MQKFALRSFWAEISEEKLQPIQIIFVIAAELVLMLKHTKWSKLSQLLWQGQGGETADLAFSDGSRSISRGIRAPGYLKESCWKAHWSTLNATEAGMGKKISEDWRKQGRLHGRSAVWINPWKIDRRWWAKRFPRDEGHFTLDFSTYLLYPQHSHFSLASLSSLLRLKLFQASVTTKEKKVSI